MADPETFDLSLSPVPGMIHIVTAAYVPGKGWLTSRRGLCVKYAPEATPLDAFTLAELEAQGNLRSMRKFLERQNLDLLGRDLTDLTACDDCGRPDGSHDPAVEH